LRRGLSGGGLRAWWPRREGSEEHPDNAHLLRRAVRFGRRLRAFALARGLPGIECQRGERKHAIAEGYLARRPGQPGRLLILIGKAQASVGEATASPWAAEVQSSGQAEYGPRRAT